MAIKKQAELEAQHPDRFEDASSWIVLANAALALPPDLMDPLFRLLMQAHEIARLAARFLSLAGIDQAVEKQNEIARAARGARDPWSVSRYAAAFAVLEDAQRDPDKRRTAARWLEQYNLIPTAAEAARLAKGQGAKAGAQAGTFSFPQKTPAPAIEASLRGTGFTFAPRR